MEKRNEIKEEERKSPTKLVVVAKGAIRALFNVLFRKHTSQIAKTMFLLVLSTTTGGSTAGKPNRR